MVKIIMGGQLRSSLSFVWWEEAILRKKMVKGDKLNCLYLGNPPSGCLKATWFDVSPAKMHFLLLAAAPGP